MKESTEKSPGPAKRRIKEIYGRYPFFFDVALVFLALDFLIFLGPGDRHPVALLLLIGWPVFIFLFPPKLGISDVLINITIILICLAGILCYFYRPRKWWAKFFAFVSLFISFLMGLAVFGYGV